MNPPVYDIAIIGGGIVGMATGLALAARPHVSVVVLEAEDRLAAHQSGHNSGVIHSGLYYQPGSLKARNCVSGRDEMYRYCQKQGIPHERCGKLVVATNESEVPALHELARRGQANGLHDLRLLGSGEIKDIEPHVNGIAGLLVGETGIVDYTQVTQSFSQEFQARGGEIQTSARVTEVRRSGDELVLTTTAGPFQTRHLIACAGLQADRVARLCGLDPGVQIVPFRGEYYELIPERRSLVRNLIYPVPDPRFPFLGVHFTRTIHGGVEAGPNAVLALKRHGYRAHDFSLLDFRQMAAYPGFWRMALKYWRTGMGELYRSISKKAFVRALRKLVPELRPGDLAYAGAGVRAQALDTQGNLVDDFRILDADRMIHVLNAPSPAATASISIGRTLADLAAKNFSLPGRKQGS